jgi:glutamine synthetase
MLPDERPLQNVSSRNSYKDFASTISFCDIRYVRIQWVDLNNQVRCRLLPVSYFRKLLELERPGVTLTKATLGIVVLQVAPGFSFVGEHIYVIDFSSFRVCSYAPGHAVFFGFFQEQVSVPRPSGPSFEVPFCPRTVLLRLLRYAVEELGIQFLVGVETEFTLLKSVDPLVPVNDQQWSTAAAVATGTVEAQVMEEIANAIQVDGIELQMYHSEGAPGQVRLPDPVNVFLRFYSRAIPIPVRSCHWPHVSTRGRGCVGPYPRDRLQHCK